MLFKKEIKKLGTQFLSEEKDLHCVIFLPNKLNKQSLLFSRLNKLNKQTELKDNTISYCFSLYICGGPCHLSSFKQCSGDRIFL